MIVDFPENETCDIIFLTNTADDDVYKMTDTAIKSLYASETNNQFRVIVVESGNQSYKYDVELTIPFTEEFNYNKALNMAFKHIQSDHVGVFNNDVIFTQNWYSYMRYYMDAFKLESASPWCPIPQRGPNEIAQKKILAYPDHTVIVGYEVLTIFAGWGWLMKRSTLEKIIPQPEDLTFWFVDNHMSMQLLTMGAKHGTVTASKVYHLGQKSYAHISPEKIHAMTHGLQEKFISKWSH
jgi:GT2 family glycosyltransferase